MNNHDMNPEQMVTAIKQNMILEFNITPMFDNKWGLITADEALNIWRNSPTCIRIATAQAEPFELNSLNSIDPVPCPALPDDQMRVFNGIAVTVKALRDQGWFMSQIHDNTFMQAPRAPDATIHYDVLIASQVDCEFSNGKESPVIGHLILRESKVDAPKNRHNLGEWFTNVRPRMNHLHAFMGDVNPLPDGIMVRPRFNGDGVLEPMSVESSTVEWSRVIQFDVTGLADGWCW